MNATAQMLDWNDEPEEGWSSSQARSAVAAKCVNRVPPRAWNGADYAQEQIKSLVQHVFFPGQGLGIRHLVVSSVEPTRASRWLCARVGRILARDTGERVCMMEADWEETRRQAEFGPAEKRPFGGSSAALPCTVRKVDHNLWLVPVEVFSGEDDPGMLRIMDLRSRISELRQEFHYTLIHAPPLSRRREAVLLGQLSDGVLLVLEANTTRRAAAQRAKSVLESSQVRLLGTVLSERTFPIPESLYRRL